MPEITVTEEELATLLEDAADAHHRYEQEELDGETDADWAQWYAQYIRNAIQEA